MAYVDILSADAFGRYNRKLAKFVGIVTACYWSEVLDISTKVLRKKKYDDEGYFKLDREYVTERTTISLEDQLASDMVLQNLGILERHPDDPCMIRIFLQNEINILADDNFKPSKHLKKTIGASKAQKSESKMQGILFTMKNCISESDEDLRAGYEGWIDAVYARKYFLTKALVKAFEEAVNNYTEDKQVKLDLLRIASLTGYRDFQWIQNKYEQEALNSSRLKEQKISKGLDINKVF